MNVLLDTNIVLALVRSRNLYGLLEYLNPDNETIYLSVVTEAEIKSILMQNDWGKSKTSRLDSILDLCTIIEVQQFHVPVYARIDAFSQRKNPSLTIYPFDTPRNMGKNDLWIATLGTLLGLQLLTTDADFNHLDGIFLDIRIIAVSELRSFF